MQLAAVTNREASNSNSHSTSLSNPNGGSAADASGRKASQAPKTDSRSSVSIMVAFKNSILVPWPCTVVPASKGDAHRFCATSHPQPRTTRSPSIKWVAFRHVREHV